MQTIFQHHATTAQTKNALKDLTKIQYSSFHKKDTIFEEQFFDCTNHILICSKKDNRVDVLVKLVASFLVSFREDPESLIGNSHKLDTKQKEKFNDFRFTFSEDFIKYIVECTKAKEKTIRQRAIEILGEIMQQLSDECELSYVFFISFFLT